MQIILAFFSIIYIMALLLYMLTKQLFSNAHEIKRDLANVVFIAATRGLIFIISSGTILPYLNNAGWIKDFFHLPKLALHFAILFFVTTSFAVYHFLFFDFRTFALRLTQCLFISFSVALLFALFSNSLIFKQSEKFWLIFGFSFSAFLLGIIYRNFFFNAITHFFFSAAYQSQCSQITLI